MQGILRRLNRKVQRAYRLQFYSMAYKSKWNALLPVFKVASSCERVTVSAGSKSYFINYTQIKLFVLGITLTEHNIRKYQIKITTSEIKLKLNIQEVYIPQPRKM